MNSKQVMRNHIGNINRAAGNSGTGSRYEFIMSQDDLMNAYFQSHKDLNYALLKQSKRDRFLVANSAGLQKELKKICDDAIQKASKQLAELVAADARNEVERQIGAALSGKSAATASNNISRSQKTSALSDAIVGGFMSGIGGILNDMFDSEDY